MYDDNLLDAHDALRQARDCCERITSALDDTSGKAEQVGDRELLERLSAARAAASRAGVLIEKLAGVLDGKQSNSTK